MDKVIAYSLTQTLVNWPNWILEPHLLTWGVTRQAQAGKKSHSEFFQGIRRQKPLYQPEDPGDFNALPH